MPDPQLSSANSLPPGSPATADGLSSGEALRRLEHYGRNVVPGAPSPSMWRRVGAQLRSPLIYILIVAGRVWSGHRVFH